ncbi:MAG: MBL fold metallo-hydrolase [Candidatus Bathyarchaeota archaeon]
MTKIELIFLGTGGGRFATITQKRRTGGIRFLSKNFNIHLDPGPGALVYSLEAGLDPQKITGVLISHCHPDHCNDAGVFIEAMTRGMTRKRGLLAAAHSVLEGNDGCEPCLSRYHQTMPQLVVDAKPEVSFSIADLRVIATKAKHSDSSTVGFRFETTDVGDIAYTSDTEYFEGIGKSYKNVRLLLLCAMRPAGSPWEGHMTTEDAVKIIDEANPEMAVLTHFGMKMIFKGPAHEADFIQEKTGVPTIAASDRMRVSMSEKIQVYAAKRKVKGLDEFLEEKIA